MEDPVPPRKYVNPSLDKIPRKKLEEKPVIDESVLKLTQNPIGLIKPASQTETVSGIKLIAPNPNIGSVSGELDEDSNRGMLRLLATYYGELLLLFLRFMTDQPNNLQLCGESLVYPKGVALLRNKCGRIVAINSYIKDPDIQSLLDKNQLTQNPVDDTKPIFSVDHFNRYYKNEFLSDKTYKESLRIVDAFLDLLYRKKPYETLIKIKKEIKQCQNKYYVMPVGYRNLNEMSGHQNLLILDKSTKEAIVIEPQFYGTEFNNLDLESQEFRLKNMYKALLDELELPYKIVLPVTTYPQAIADDLNCMFWTFLITVTYFLNASKVTPNEISTAIINKYRTKEALHNYIEGFKVYLYQYADAFEKIKKTAGRRRTYRKHGSNRATRRKRILSRK